MFSLKYDRLCVTLILPNDSRVQIVIIAACRTTGCLTDESPLRLRAETRMFILILFLVCTAGFMIVVQQIHENPVTVL